MDLGAFPDRSFQFVFEEVTIVGSLVIAGFGATQRLRPSCLGSLSVFRYTSENNVQCMLKNLVEYSNFTIGTFTRLYIGTGSRRNSYSSSFRLFSFTSTEILGYLLINDILFVVGLSFRSLRFDKTGSPTSPLALETPPIAPSWNPTVTTDSSSDGSTFEGLSFCSDLKLTY